MKKMRNLISDRHPLRLIFHKLKAVLAALIYRFPANQMIVVGITGTNGKTTTTNLVTNILHNAGYKVGMTSTINFRIGDKTWVNDSKQSTASPFKLQKLLREMVTAGCKYAVVEVTSHAVTQSRIWGINFDVAVITNVTADHIEYHGNFNNYLEAKGGLFKAVSKGRRKFGISKVAILNKDDAYYEYFDRFVFDRKIVYGLKGATVYPTELVKGPEGSKFILNVPNNKVPVEIALPGEYNVSNALAAASVCMALEIPLEKVRDGLKASTAIAGRFEHVEVGQKYSVIVDYAHTPDALESLFSLYKKLTQGRLFVVFGATGGGRDKGKRMEMGQIADKYADFIIVTDDDPYEEDEWEILDGVCEGIARKEGAGLWKIPDRREALRLALTMAREGDVVIAAGKGAEEVMMVRGERVVWNDKKVIEELLKRNVVVEIGEDEWVERPNVCMQS